MRTKFISFKSLEDNCDKVEACLEILDFEPFCIEKVDSGYFCFESEDDFNTWQSYT